MKPAHNLLNGWGSGNEAEVARRGILTSMPSSDYDTAELAVSFPISDHETELISEAVARRSPDLLLLFLSGDAVEQTGAIFFKFASRNRWRVPIVVMCPTAKPHDVTELFRLGASEVLTMPLSSKVIARLLALHSRGHEGGSSVAQLRATLGLEHLIGESPAFIALIKEIPPIAKYDVGVLILGETGTGKEVFARAIHYCSPRADKPFIPVNCGAIPVDLLENEFFGHESGAFTSANSSRRGVIKEADRGTLFLDEVDCLPHLSQVKLLRFLQDGQFRPLGSASICSADVRVIAASNANLTESLETGRFRKDLYYRLNVLTLKLPALREREDDIVLLARHFLTKYTDKFRTPAREFSPAALEKLLYHTWPGNVRELENIIQRAVVLASNATIQANDICVQAGNTCATDVSADQSTTQNFQQLKAQAIAQFEQNYVRRMLTMHGGNITKAAQGAGKERRTFWQLMRKHGLTAQPSPSKGPNSTRVNRCSA
jgi:DNA-binding NtrC family response regulator